MKQIPLTFVLLTGTAAAAFAQSVISPQDTVNGVPIGTIGSDAVGALQTGTTARQSVAGLLDLPAGWTSSIYDPVTPTTSGGAKADFAANDGTNYIDINAMRLGGFPSTLPGNPGNYAGGDGALQIFANPGGYYDQGSMLDLTMSNAAWNGARPGICGGADGGNPFNPTGWMAANSCADMVQLYEEVRNTNPRIVVASANTQQTITFTANTIVLTPALTDFQLSLLRSHLWIATNLQDPGVNPQPPVSTEQRTLWTQLVGWTSNPSATTLNVYDFAVPGQNRPLSGGSTGNPIVPAATSSSGASLVDTTVFAGRGTATIAIGVPGKVFNQNWYDEFDPGNTDSQIRQIAGLEMDEVDNNADATRPVNWTGLTIGHAKNYGVPADINSYQLKVVGGGAFNSLVQLGGATDEGHLIDTFDHTTGKLGGVYTLNDAGFLPATAAGQELLEERALLEGTTSTASRFREVLYGQRMVANGQGWQQAELCRAGFVDGAPFSTGGTPMASYCYNPVYNGASVLGGVAISGSGTNPGIVVTGAGTTILAQPRVEVAPTGLTGGNDGLVIGNQPTGSVAGFGLYATAGYGNNLLEILNGATPEMTLSSTGSLALGVSLASGSNGLTVGTLPSGHVTGFGLYAAAGYGNNLMEILNGATSEMTLSSTGGLTLNGGLIAGTVQASGGLIAAATGALTLAASSCGTTINDSGSTAHTFTIPYASLPIGCTIGVVQGGSGKITVVGATSPSNEVIEAYSGASISAGQYATLTIKVLSSATAVVTTGLP